MNKNAQVSIPVIYHNPACGTSRSVLASLRAAGLEPRVVEYLDQPPDRETLKSLLKLMGRNVREILRKRGTPYEELGLDRADLNDDAIFDAIAAHPILIERPIVVIGESAALCRPAELVNALIAAEGKSS
jgi:arsenate reductase